MKGHRGYNICPWIKNGKREICGKSCREEYCKVHRRYIRNGSRIPLPCLNCGIGVRSQIQLCRECGRENVRRGACWTRNLRYSSGMAVFNYNQDKTAANYNFVRALYFSPQKLKDNEFLLQDKTPFEYLH